MPVGRRTLLGCGLAAIAATAIAAPLSSGAATSGTSQKASATTKVTVADDYFAPTDVTIKQGDKVQWIWAPANTDTHDVVLSSKHPKGVKAKDFRSSSGAIGLKFKRKFDVPGTYGFICTYHKTVMKVDLTVKKK
jgi:plastocyanin